jgi:hypothetical protein
MMRKYRLTFGTGFSSGTSFVFNSLEDLKAITCLLDSRQQGVTTEMVAGRYRCIEAPSFLEYHVETVEVLSVEEAKELQAVYVPPVEEPPEPAKE